MTHLLTKIWKDIQSARQTQVPVQINFKFPGTLSSRESSFSSIPLLLTKQVFQSLATLLQMLWRRVQNSSRAISDFSFYRSAEQPRRVRSIRLFHAMTTLLRANIFTFTPLLVRQTLVIASPCFASKWCFACTALVLASFCAILASSDAKLGNVAYNSNANEKTRTIQRVPEKASEKAQSWRISETGKIQKIQSQA